MIKLLNKVTIAPDVKKLGWMLEGETFILNGDLGVMVDGDPKFMILGGNHSGEVVDIEDSEEITEATEVTVVDIEITWRHKSTSAPRKKKK